MLIKGDRVKMFGCHLPLSSNTAKYGTIGLRHTAALGLADAGRGIRQYLASQYPGRNLPRFEVNVALHNGPVTLARLQDPLHDAAAQILPVGDAVTTTMLLQKQAHQLGWSIASSVSTLRGITGAVQIDRRALVSLPGRSAALDAVEMVALAL